MCVIHAAQAKRQWFSVLVVAWFVILRHDGETNYGGCCVPRYSSCFSANFVGINHAGVALARLLGNELHLSQKLYDMNP